MISKLKIGSILKNACVTCNYQESVTIGQKDTWTDRRTERWTERQTQGQTDAGQSDPYVPLCFEATQKCKKKKKG